MDTSTFSVRDLLSVHCKICDELRLRGITRSANNPTGDFAEYLFCKAFGWQQAGKSHSHIDALDSNGVRFQIKGRRLTRQNKSRQLSFLRNLDEQHFDFLAGVLFGEDFTIFKAALVPWAVALEKSVYVSHTNGYRFLLRDDIWLASGVRDVTAELRDVDLSS
jgi:hypothetical protein